MRRFSAFILIGSLLVSGCKKKVEEATVSLKPISESVYASGVVRSIDQHEVFAGVAGRVKAVLVKEGDIVLKGQPILSVQSIQPELNARNTELAAKRASLANNQEKVEEKRLQMELAYAQMKNDSLLLARQRNLWSQNIGTRLELEQRQLASASSSNAYKAARLGYMELLKDLEYSSAQAKTSLEISKSILGDFTVSALHDGRVYRLEKKAGEYVNALTPIATIGNADHFDVELNVDERDIGRVREGQRTFLRMDSYKNETFEGKITSIEPIMNEDSQSFLVKAEFNKTPPVIFPNLTVEANILISHKDEGLIIPARFMTTDSTVTMKGGKVRKVTPGLQDYQWIEIISGLKEGEVIQQTIK